MVKKWVIELADVPADTTIEKFILKNTDLSHQIRKFSDFQTQHVKVPIHFNTNLLCTDTLEILTQINMYPFRYKDVDHVLKNYLSASLTWNPKSKDKLSNDPHQSTLGSSKYSSGNADFYSFALAERNTYADSYGFLQRTPLSRYESLGQFIDAFKRTLIRSRISKISGIDPSNNDQSHLWHKDESIFLNLRINIPIQSTRDYVIEVMKESPADPFAVEIEEFELLPGHAYVYNTELVHRPYCKKHNSLERINIICGISPWFDFSPKTKAWCSNEYYGQVHPFEMLEKGYMSEFIKA